MPAVRALLYLFLWTMKTICERKNDYSKKSCPFWFFPRVAEAFCTRTHWSRFWMHCACTKEIDLFSDVLCTCAKDTKQNMFLQSFRREHCILEAACWIQLVLCEGESMVRPTDCAPAKVFPVKKRDFWKFKKEHLETWPFIAIDQKDDACVNSQVCSTVVKW